MNLEKLLIVCKESEIDHDKAKFALSNKALKEQYKRDGVDYISKYASHQNQITALQFVKTYLKDADFISIRELRKQQPANYEMIGFLGGDDTLKEGTHFFENIPILSMTSDPTRSEGALNIFTYHDAEIISDALKSDTYKTITRNRINVEIDGLTMRPGLCEIYLGTEDPEKMTHLDIKCGTIEDRLKGSGLLISSAAGATGWYKSAGGNRVLPAESDQLLWVMREPYFGKLPGNTHSSGVVSPNSVLKITAQMRFPGRISVDSINSDRASFNRGTTAKIYSGKPLEFVTLDHI